MTTIEAPVRPVELDLSVPGPRGRVLLASQEADESSARTYPRRLPVAIAEASGPGSREKVTVMTIIQGPMTSRTGPGRSRCCPPGRGRRGARQARGVEVRRHVGRRCRALRAVAGRLVAARRQGTQVVAVLSAMGGTTDELARQAYDLSAEPQPRELDALLSAGEMMSCALAAMAVHDLGERAVSLTGAQAGIFTDGAHWRPRPAIRAGL